MDYRKHTKERFYQKFLPIIKSKKKNFWKGKTSNNWVEFTDDDYLNLIEVSKTPIHIHKEKSRVLVRYKDTLMWCVLTKKKKVVKTIYPICRSDFRKYVENK
jgi:hypothetical protein